MMRHFHPAAAHGPWDGICFIGGGGSGSSNTTTQVQQIPAFEQQESQSNQNLANSLAAQPYPTYKAPLQAQFSPQQQQSFSQVGQAATAAQPYIGAATNQLQGAVQTGNNANAIGSDSLGTGALGSEVGLGSLATGNNATALGDMSLALNPANGAALSAYMSPYVQQSLAPQMTELQTQLGQQQQQLGAQATSANAFGDARQGAEASLNNFYGDQSMSGLLANGYNTAFSNALSSMNQEQQNQMAEQGQQMTEQGQQAGEQQNLTAEQQAQMGEQSNVMGEQQNQMTGATDLATLGGQLQSTDITGANALYDAGQQQQNQQQQGLNLAYQQYQNQVQYPYQMLNVRESALSNSPYTIANQVTLPNANPLASSLGSFASTAGGLGSLFGSGANANVFGSS